MKSECLGCKKELAGGMFCGADCVAAHFGVDIDALKAMPECEAVAAANIARMEIHSVWIWGKFNEKRKAADKFADEHGVGTKMPPHLLFTPDELEEVRERIELAKTPGYLMPDDVRSAWEEAGKRVMELEAALVAKLRARRN